MLPELVAFWLSRLPLTEDKGESRVAIRQLCARIDANCAATLQPTNLVVVRSRLQQLYVDAASLTTMRPPVRRPQALSVFAKIVSSDTLCTEVLARFIMGALHHLKSAMPAEALGAVWGTLVASEQSILTRFMSDPRVGGGAASPVRALRPTGSPGGTGAGVGAGAGASNGSPFA